MAERTPPPAPPPAPPPPELFDPTAPGAPGGMDNADLPQEGPDVPAQERR